MDAISHIGKVALVVNTRSRTGERTFFRALDQLSEFGINVGATYALRDPGRLPEAVQSVLDDGYDTLILGGGDGTVSSVVDFLAHHHATLALLPLGTANDFARTLGIPSDVDAACEVIARGKLVDIDLGLVGDNYYVNVATIGIGVGVTQALSAGLKRRVGALAYPLAAVRAFLTHEPFTARLVFPEGDRDPVEHERLLQIAVGNGRFYGGGMVVAPESGIDDHTLDVYAIEMGRHRDLLGVARYMKSGDFIRNEAVHQYRTRSVSLEVEPARPINVDGELVARTPATFTIARNALKVIVPENSTAASRENG
jgi:YegS/Rv2252/BmrU family lipid kinase